MVQRASLHPIAEKVRAVDFFWEGTSRHELLIYKCGACGRYSHPPRPVCRFCLSDDLGPAGVSGDGDLYSFTVAIHPFDPAFVDSVPYVIAVVELAEQRGLLLLSNLISCPEPRVGMPVEVEFCAGAGGVVLPLFRPRKLEAAPEQ